MFSRGWWHTATSHKVHHDNVLRNPLVQYNSKVRLLWGKLSTSRLSLLSCMSSDHVSQGCETCGSTKGTLRLGSNPNWYDGPRSSTKPMHRHCKAQIENVSGSVCKCLQYFLKVGLPWQSCLSRRETCSFFFCPKMLKSWLVFRS